MGDHRLSVDIKLTGIDLEQRTVSMWVNFHDGRVKELWESIRKLVEDSGFYFDDSFLYEFDDRFEHLNDYINLLKEKIESLENEKQ